MSARTWKINSSHRDPEWLVVIGPFDQGFIDRIKDAIDPRDREWLGVAKAWKVRATERSKVEAIISDLVEVEPEA